MRIRKRSLFLVLGLALWLQCVTSIFASDLSIETKIGIEGNFKLDRYVPINITVTNTGEDFTGTLQILQGYDRVDYLEKVDIPGGTTKNFKIPMWFSENYNMKPKINLLDANNKTIESKLLYLPYLSLNNLDLAIGVLTEDSYKLNYFSGIDLRLNESYQTKSFPIEAQNINENVKNIDLIDLLVINNYNTSSLLPEQIQSIEKWVEQGGTLIIGTGDNGKKTLSGFKEPFLSVQIADTYNKNMDILGESISLECADLQINDNAKQMMSSSLYHELYQVIRKGAGTIIVMNYDLGLDPMAHFGQNKEMWKRIFVDEVTVDNANASMNYWRIEDELSHINNHHLLVGSKLFIILGIYIVLLGIVSYFVLKKKQKKEWIWIVAPALAILMTAVIYILALPSRLAPYVVNQLDMAWTDKTGFTKTTSYLSILNSQGKKMTILEPDDTSFKMVEADSYHYYEDEEDQTTNKHISYEGGKMRYQMEDCGIYDTTFIMSEAKKNDGPSYTYTYTENNANIQFELTNTGDKEIERLFMINQDRIWDLGRVAIGETASKNASLAGGMNMWDLVSQFEQDHELASLGSIINILQDWGPYNYSSKYGYLSYGPAYVAVTKMDEPMSLLSQNNATDFCYQVSVVELAESLENENEIAYPYDYFRPEIKQQSGTGYVDENGPVSTLNGDITVDLVYTIAADCQIETIDLGFNEEAMSDYYYNTLNGDISIYNFQTEIYENITNVSMWGNKTIDHETMDEYVKDGQLRIRVVGINEESGLVPSIAVKGTAYVKN